MALLALVLLGCGKRDPIEGSWELVSSANQGEVWAPPAWTGTMSASDGTFARSYIQTPLEDFHFNSGTYQVEGERVRLHITMTDYTPLMFTTFHNTWDADGDRLTFRGDGFEEIWVRAE